MLPHLLPSHPCSSGSRPTYPVTSLNCLMAVGKARKNAVKHIGHWLTNFVCQVLESALEATTARDQLCKVYPPLDSIRAAASRKDAGTARRCPVCNFS